MKVGVCAAEPRGIWAALASDWVMSISILGRPCARIEDEVPGVGVPGVGVPPVGVFWKTPASKDELDASLCPKECCASGELVNSPVREKERLASELESQPKSEGVYRALFCWYMPAAKGNAPAAAVPF